MRAIKEARKFIESNAANADAITLSRLVLALESEIEFPITDIYALDYNNFKLALEILQEWRLDRHFAGKSRLYDASLHLAGMTPAKAAVVKKASAGKAPAKAAKPAATKVAKKAPAAKKPATPAAKAVAAAKPGAKNAKVPVTRKKTVADKKTAPAGTPVTAAPAADGSKP